MSHNGSSVNDYFIVSLDFPESKIAKIEMTPRVEPRRQKKRQINNVLRNSCMEGLFDYYSMTCFETSCLRSSWTNQELNPFLYVLSAPFSSLRGGPGLHGKNSDIVTRPVISLKNIFKKSKAIHSWCYVIRRFDNDLSG